MSKTKEETRKKPWWYLSSIQIGLAAAFGGAALAVVLGGLMIPMGPGGLVADPRMPFAFVGAALTGPVGAIIVGFLAGVGRIPLYNIPFHVIGEVVFFGIPYKYVYRRAKSLKKLIALFNVLTFFYYFPWETVYWPFVVAYFIMKEPEMVVPLYFSYLPAMVGEMIASMIIQSVILSVLPERIRRPQW